MKSLYKDSGANTPKPAPRSAPKKGPLVVVGCLLVIAAALMYIFWPTPAPTVDDPTKQAAEKLRADAQQAANATPPVNPSSTQTGTTPPKGKAIPK